MPEINDPLSGPVIRTREAAPLQGQTVPFMTGLAGRATAATVGSLGFSVLNPLVHTAIDGGPDNHLLDHDDAVAQLKALGPKFDPSVLPAGRVYQTTLDAIKDQQTVVNNASDAADRSSSAGGVSQFVAGLAGGMNDPLFLALGPLGRVGKGIGEVAGLAKGASVGVRAATGAAEGGAVMGGYTEAQKHLGTSPGDRDITSYEVLQQTGVGMVIGGAVKAALGKRLSPEVTASLERSDNAAKLLKISVDNVVSPKGAVGKFQIMPDTARQYMGEHFDVSTLHDPAVNAHVNQVILDDLQKRFPDDMEAQAIAYNAGPGRATKWIAAGRNDSVLPLETQKYVAHLRSIRDQSPLAEAAALPPEVKTAAMTTAVAQVAEDSEVNVDPIIKNALAEKAKEMNEVGWQSIKPEEKDAVYNPIVPEAPPPTEDAIPHPGSAITNERLTADMLAQVNEAAKVKVPEGSEFEEVNKQAADAEKIAEHAHAMAFGEPAEGATSGFKTVMDDLEEDGKKGDELAKAVDAAVRCGAMKGLE